MFHEKRAELGLATMTMILISCKSVDREKKDVIKETRGCRPVTLCSVMGSLRDCESGKRMALVNATGPVVVITYFQN
jgi:hypothetical protein